MEQQQISAKKLKAIQKAFSPYDSNSSNVISSKSPVLAGFTGNDFQYINNPFILFLQNPLFSMAVNVCSAPRFHDGVFYKGKTALLNPYPTGSVP